MLTLARHSIRHPLASLTAWAVVAAALIAIGLGVADRVLPTMTFAPGTESSRAQDLAEDRFGPSTLVPILLSGPRAQLDAQGPRLVRRLAARPDTRVLSAWDAGESGAALRPSRTDAMIVASVARSERAMVGHVQADIDRTVHASVSRGVRAHITGQPTLDRAIQDEALDTARTATLLALPLLFIALMLVLRSPVAAGIVTGFGAVTAFAGFGVLSLVATAFEVDAIGVALAAVMGLALGTSLSLMILLRYRADRDVALETTVGSAGPAVLIGGTGLVLALGLASLIGPTPNLMAIGAGTVINALLAIGAAVVVMPTLLALLGMRVFALEVGTPRLLGAPWSRLVGAGGLVLRRAVIAGAAATLALVALAVPALGVKTGPPDPSFLPADSQARQDFEAVQRAMGPGWPTPYNIVVVSKRGPITGRAMLRSLERFQVRLAKDPRVDAVAGPGLFRAKTAALGTLKAKLNQSNELLGGAGKDLGKLQSGLGQAGAGAVELQGGLRDAASGANQLESGGGQAQSGAGKLRDGISAARAGSAKISSGLDQALDGANALKAGSADALVGATKVSEGLGEAVKPVKAGVPVVQQMAQDVAAGNTAVKSASGTAQTLADQLNAASSALGSMGAGKSDPKYAQVADALSKARQSAGGLSSTLGGVGSTMDRATGVSAIFSDSLVKLSSGLDQLYTGSTQLTGGIARLRDGNAALAKGIDKLSGGGGQLTGGLDQLRTGAGSLETGLGQLTGGAGQLAGGLSGGVPQVGTLSSGLGTMESGVARFRRSLPSTKDLEQLQAQAPGLFDSGYFVLAAISGARAADRNQATFAVNLARGGNAGQITVISKSAAGSAATKGLGDHLSREARAFALRTGSETAVGGPAGELSDFQSYIGSRIWPVVVGLALAVTLMLAIALRSVLLPLVTVAFNLLTAAATFGVLTLLTTGDDPLLGGPGYIDPLQVIETFAAVFGIALIYELLLLYRTRELYVGGETPHGALAAALRETAGAATGAAAVMLAAIVPFTLSGLFNLRLLVGLAIAVLIDALIVRPVLLPAAVELLGRRGWWPTVGRSVRAEAQSAPGSKGRSRFRRRRRAPAAR